MTAPKIVALLLLFACTAGAPDNSIVSTNRPKPRVVYTAPSPKEMQASYVARIAVLEKKIADLQTKDRVEAEHRRLQFEAKVINERQESAMSMAQLRNTARKLKPLQTEIARLKLQEFELRQRYNLPAFARQPSTKKKMTQGR